jgi:hypothetical protein
LEFRRREAGLPGLVVRESSLKAVTSQLRADTEAEWRKSILPMQRSKAGKGKRKQEGEYLR